MLATTAARRQSRRPRTTETTETDRNLSTGDDRPGNLFQEDSVELGLGLGEQFMSPDLSRLEQEQALTTRTIASPSPHLTHSVDAYLEALKTIRDFNHSSNETENFQVVAQSLSSMVNLAIRMVERGEHSGHGKAE